MHAVRLVSLESLRIVPDVLSADHRDHPRRPLRSGVLPVLHQVRVLSNMTLPSLLTDVQVPVQAGRVQVLSTHIVQIRSG
jgi:hypothetical protein